MNECLVVAASMKAPCARIIVAPHELWMILSNETRNEPTKLFRMIQNTSHDQGKGTSGQNTA
jgi:hypothetical protein